MSAFRHSRRTISIIREIISNIFYPRASSNGSSSAASVRESEEEGAEVEELISNNGQVDNDARTNVASNLIDPAAPSSSERRHAGVDIPTILDYEYESISAAPVRRVERRTRKRSTRRRFTSRTSSTVAEPPSPRNLDDFEQYPATFPVPYICHGVKKEESPEPQAGPSRLAPPSEPRQEAQPLHNDGLPADDSRASKPIKRRRRGPRLTRIKNERAKRAKARAEAAARCEAVAPSPTGQREDIVVHRNTRAAARVVKCEEVKEEVKEEEEVDRKKDQGKGKARDVPSTDEAPTGSKRRRAEEDDDAQAGGPSRPTRRTRRQHDTATEARATTGTLENSEQVKQEDDGTERRKDKGKGKEKDVPSTGEAPTGSKRRRDEDEDDGDSDARQAGPSRPMRRTRQRRETATEPKLEDCDDVKPPMNNVRQLRSRPVPVPDVSAPDTRKRKHRCLAPEPSEELIDAARKRVKMETPEPGPGPVASSSRVTVEDLVRWENWHSEQTSVKLEHVKSEAPLAGPSGGSAGGHAGNALVKQAPEEDDWLDELEQFAQELEEHYQAQLYAQAQELINQIIAEQVHEPPPNNHLGFERQLAAALELRERAANSIPPAAATYGLERIPTRPRTDHLERQETTIYGLKVYRPDY